LNVTNIILFRRRKRSAEHESIKGREMHFQAKKSAEVRSRIEPSLKEQSAGVLASMGLDMSDAIRLFLRQVVEVRGLPFEVRKPNEETVAAMLEAREMAKAHKARFSSAQELFDELDAKGSKEARSAATKI
jgi:DNA-damage-inducible protein J